MAVNADEVFKDKDLTLFLKIQKHIPPLFKKIKLSAELICLVNGDKSPSHFYIEVKPEHKEEGIKLFASIELTEMAKKAYLLENIISLIEERNNLDIRSALLELNEKDRVYLTIEHDIEVLASILSFNRQDTISRLEVMNIENMTVH